MDQSFHTDETLQLFEMQSIEDEFVLDRFSSKGETEVKLSAASQNMPPVMQSSYFNPQLPSIKPPQLQVTESAIDIAGFKAKQLSHQDLLFSRRSKKGSQSSKRDINSPRPKIGFQNFVNPVQVNPLLAMMQSPMMNGSKKQLNPQSIINNTDEVQQIMTPNIDSNRNKDLTITVLNQQSQQDSHAMLSPSPRNLSSRQQSPRHQKPEIASSKRKKVIVAQNTSHLIDDNELVGFSFSKGKPKNVEKSSVTQSVSEYTELSLKQEVKLEQHQVKSPKNQAVIEIQNLSAHDDDSSETSLRQRQMWDAAIGAEIEDAKQTKAQQKSVKFLMETILNNSESAHLTQILSASENMTDNKFALVMSTTVVIIHIYNMFTCFFFMGIEGHMTGLWLIIEILFEIIMIFELCIQFLLRTQFKFLWKEMYLMRDTNNVKPMSKLQICNYLICALPKTTICRILLLKYPGFDENFYVQCTRIVKLTRWYEVKRYFEQFEQQSRKRGSNSNMKLLYIFLFLLVFLHFWTCIWLITGRMDHARGPTAGWYHMAKFDTLDPSWVAQYAESFYFIVTTFSGAGFGNIIPTTTLEWFVDTFLNLIGSSLFTFIFVDFVMEFSMKDLQKFQNDNMVDQMLQFAESTSLPESLVFKIRYYYKDLNLQFEDLKIKKQIVQQMPQSIQGSVSIMLNREIIESVKFFQQADPQFITEISTLLSPQICMNDDFIVKMDDVAKSMFFIHSGYIEVLCKNNQSTLIYLSKGSYFGEIGVLLTGKRSLSVRAKSNAVVYSIGKVDLDKLLKKFPRQLKFLKDVGQQRLDTTPYDNANNFSESDLTSQNKSTQSKTAAKFGEMNALFERANTTTMAKKPWFNQKLDSLKSYIILPFSPIWWLWNITLCTAITINCIMIPYGLGFEANYWKHPAIIFGWIIYSIDIPIRIRTGITSNHQITINTENSLRDYVNKWLFMDVITAFPFEYMLMGTGEAVWVPYVLLIRMLKFLRLVEISEIVRKNSRHSISTAAFFLQLFCLYFFMTHWLACIFGNLGRQEFARNPKYDGNSFFKDFEARPFITLGHFWDLSLLDQYKVSIYVASSIISAATYGDCIPSTLPEQIIVSTALVFTNTMRGFLFVRMAKFLGNLQNNQIVKIKKSNEIEKYMRACKLPKSFMTKIYQFTHTLRHEKSLYEGSQILENLPKSLTTEIYDYLEQSQIKQQENQSMKVLKFYMQSKLKKQLQSEGLPNTELGNIESKPNLTRQYIRFNKFKHFKEMIVLLVLNYNIWFIPIQYAFQIPFDSYLLLFEVITILVYLGDIGFLYHSTSWLRNLDCVDNDVLRRKDRKIQQSILLQRKEINQMHQQIGITLLALFPLSLIISSVPGAYLALNKYVHCGLASLRLVKVRPLTKYFAQKQKDQLTKWRILSTVYTYYCIANWFTNIMIRMAIYDEDWTTNWLRRCPVPQPKGTRTDPYYRGDLSLISIYIHALYYVVSTFSHVAIADITAVNQEEFVVNAIFEWFAFFIYCLLYADITLLVSNAGSPNYKNFIAKRNTVISQITSPDIPKVIVSQATLYLDYTYEIYEGVAQEEIVKELPDKLKMEFLLEKHKNFIDKSILFRVSSTADINLALAQDVLKNIKVQIFLNETFILKVGEILTETILLLDGHINVLTVSNVDVLGQFSIGDFYGTDLDNVIFKEYNNKFFAKSQKDQPPSLQLDPSDNFDYRSLVHLVARKFVTVGYLDQSKLEFLYKRHPGFKTCMRRSNRFMFDVGRKSVEQQLNSAKIPITREACMNILNASYETSSDANYKDIIKLQRSTLMINQINKDDEKVLTFSQIKKMYWINQLQKEMRHKLRGFFLRVEHDNQQDTSFVICCEELVIYESSNFRKFLILTMFINRIYVALMLPFYIGFNIDLQSTSLIIDCISHGWSLVCFILQFRTPVVKETGELTLEFKLVLQNYIKNGMVLDILAFQPFNLIIPYFVDQSPNCSYQSLILVICLTPLRMIRMVSVLRIFALFDQVKVEFRSIQYALTMIGNLFFVFLMGHWAVCAWLFLTSVVEQKFAMNWQSYQGYPNDHSLLEIYIHNWYAIANIISTVGSGDIFGTTDLERLFFVCLMTCGDIIFALAFGLLSELTSNQRANNPQQNFITSLIQSQRIMQQAKFNDNWKDRVQQYLTYKHQLKSSWKNLNADQLKDALPDCLIKEILYFANRGFIVTLFCGIESENLIRDLAFVTTTQIQMPDDIIISRNQQIEEICYIIEGSATKYNKKNKPFESLEPGQFIGEFALLKDSRPKFQLRADTFMLLKMLKKTDILKLLDQYPLFYKHFLLQLEGEGSQNSSSQVSEQSKGFGIPMGSIRQKSFKSQSISSSSSESSESEESVYDLEIRDPHTRERRMTVDPTTIMKSHSISQRKPMHQKVSSQSLATMIATQQFNTQKTKFSVKNRRLSQESAGSQLKLNQGEHGEVQFQF